MEFNLKLKPSSIDSTIEFRRNCIIKENKLYYKEIIKYIEHIKRVIITEGNNDIFVTCFKKRANNTSRIYIIPVYQDTKPRIKKIGSVELNMTYKTIDLHFLLNIHDTEHLIRKSRDICEDVYATIRSFVNNDQLCF